MDNEDLSKEYEEAYRQRAPVDHLDELCAECGFRKGSHHGGNYYSIMYRMHVPYNYCPGHEGRMDWDKGPGTCFKPTGKYKKNSNG